MNIAITYTTNPGNPVTYNIKVTATGVTPPEEGAVLHTGFPKATLNGSPSTVMFGGGDTWWTTYMNQPAGTYGATVTVQWDLAITTSASSTVPIPS